MHHLTRCALLSTLLCITPFSHANTIQRCEDATGNVTFTSLGCAAEQHSQAVDAFNAPPGSVAPALLPGKEAGRLQPRSRLANKEVVVVGQRDDGCGNRLSAEQRRTAIINQRTPPGMTKRDVESLLGRPDRVTQRNGEERYHYSLKNGRSNQVAFDQEGCVKGKR